MPTTARVAGINSTFLIIPSLTAVGAPSNDAGRHAQRRARVTSERRNGRYRKSEFSRFIIG
jgi:hypothetical protein